MWRRQKRCIFRNARGEIPSVVNLKNGTSHVFSLSLSLFLSIWPDISLNIWYTILFFLMRAHVRTAMYELCYFYSYFIIIISKYKLLFYYKKKNIVQLYYKLLEIYRVVYITIIINCRYLFRLDDKYRGRAAAIRKKKNERRVRRRKRGRMNGRQTGVICPGSFVGFVTRPSG